MATARLPLTEQPEFKTSSTAEMHNKLNTPQQLAAIKRYEKSKKIRAQAEIIISKKEYKERVEQIAKVIAEKCGGAPVILLKNLEGGCYIARLLEKALEKLGVGCEQASIKTSSYGHGIVASKEVTLIPAYKDPKLLEGRDVVFCEDIVDTGDTLAKVLEWIKEQKPARFTTVSGIDKPDNRSKINKGIAPDHVVHTTKNPYFLFGSGMDAVGYGREIDGVYAAAPELFQPTPPASPRNGCS